MRATREEGLGRTGAGAASAARRRPRRAIRGLRWWIALLLMGVTVVNYLDRSCLSVVAPTLKSRLSIDEIGFSHIVVAFQITYMIMQPIAGRVVDWLGLRIGLAVSIAWWSAAQMLTAFAAGARSLAALRALLGVGEASSFPGAVKAVSLWFRPRERTLATGLLNIGAGVGALIAPPLVVAIVLRHSWRLAFVVTGVLGLAWVALWLAAYRAPAEHPLLSPEERDLIEAEREVPRPADAGANRGLWLAALGERRFWAMAIARFLSEPAWQFFTNWIPLYLATERHMRLREIGYFAWMPFFAADLGCIFGGALSPFFVRLGSSVLTARKLSATVSATCMVFAAFIGRAPTAGWAIALFCVGAFAHQSMSSTLLTLPADIFPARMVATASGLTGTSALAGGMLFTLATGVIAERWGYGPLFVVIAFLDLVGSAVLWALLRESGPRPTPSAGRAPSLR